MAQKHFNAPVDTLEGTVKRASSEGVELEEYPGRTFRFSTVGMKMADLVADDLGRRNSLSRAAAVEDAGRSVRNRERWLADTLAAGTRVSLVVPRGAAASSARTRSLPGRAQHFRARAGETGRDPSPPPRRQEPGERPAGIIPLPGLAGRNLPPGGPGTQAPEGPSGSARRRRPGVPGQELAAA